MSEEIKPEIRYCVPLTLEEIEALQNSICWNIFQSEQHKNALEMLNDVYFNNCEWEIIQDAENVIISDEPNII